MKKSLIEDSFDEDEDFVKSEVVKPDNYLNQFVVLFNDHVVYVEDWDGEYFFASDEEGGEHHFKIGQIKGIAAE